MTGNTVHNGGEAGLYHERVHLLAGSPDERRLELRSLVEHKRSLDESQVR